MKTCKAMINLESGHAPGNIFKPNECGLPMELYIISIGGPVAYKCEAGHVYIPEVAERAFVVITALALGVGLLALGISKLPIWD